MTDTMQAEAGTEANEAQIAVHWQEEKYIQPPREFVEQAILRDPDVRKRFGEEHFPDCFREYADMLTWYEPYKQVLDTSNPPFWKWFTGGKLNACYNCVDRHLDQYRNKAALIFVAEPEDAPPYAMTYQELYVRVNEMAALLRDYCGLKAGDRVTLHLPMTLELPITMLACARLGIIHSQVFGGFSGQSCGQRIQDSGSRYLITEDAYWRSGKLIDHKANADIAVKTAEDAGQHVDKVLVWQRYPGKYSSPTPMVKDRDVFINEILKDYAGKRVDPVPMDAEAPLFLMYSSGTTGKPKGCQHRTGGYMAYVTGT
ncbi:MAG: AMP-binding protein, partial [Rhodanobacteraceae bacterium]